MIITLLDKVLEAIHKINPNAGVTMSGNTIDELEIEWLDGTTPISKADIETKMAELQTVYDNNKYQRDRVYPSIGDQLDMLWHSIDEDPTLKSKYFTFYEAIKSVKVKNPK